MPSRRVMCRSVIIPAFSQTDYGTYGEEILFVPTHAVVFRPSDVSSVTFAAV